MIDRNLAKNVFMRDGWRCRHCKDTNGLHPHHVIFKSQQGKDELNNLVTLCWQCHRALHDGFLVLTVNETLANDLRISFTRRKGWQPS